MNKTLIVLGAGIWGVLILLRFVLSSVEANTFQFLNILEIVAFVITRIHIKNYSFFFRNIDTWLFIVFFFSVER
jgi:hypothetical protein